MWSNLFRSFVGDYRLFVNAYRPFSDLSYFGKKVTQEGSKSTWVQSSCCCAAPELLRQAHPWSDPSGKACIRILQSSQEILWSSWQTWHENACFHKLLIEKTTKVHYWTKNLCLSFGKNLFLCAVLSALIRSLLISCKHDQDQPSVYVK